MTAYPRVRGVVTRQGNNRSEEINAAADAVNCPPRLLVAQGIAESNLNEEAERYGDWPDWSVGLWQQTIRFAPIGDHSASAANVAFVRERFLTDFPFALKTAAGQLGYYWQMYDERESMSRYNGGPMMQLARNPNARHIEASWADSARYVEPAMTFDPTIPRVAQQLTWSCSVATTTWLLQTLGQDATLPAMRQAMLAAGLVTPELGLLDGDGSTLAEWLTRTYALDAHAKSPVTFEWVSERAGQMPLGIGGARWYHWVGVRGVDTDGALLLANPAEGYKGIYGRLTEFDFAKLGPFAAVWIALPTEDEMADCSELESQLSELRRVAENEVLRNIDKALTYRSLPKGARDALEHGAKPAAETLARGGG